VNNIAKKTGVYVKCECCGKEIYKTMYNFKKHKHHYCSNECQLIVQHNAAFEMRKCEICGKEFSVSKKSTQRFCSNECQHKWQKKQTGENNSHYDRVQVWCDYCGKPLLIIPANETRFKHHFCDENCRKKWYASTWSQNPNWKLESRRRAAKMLPNSASTGTLPHRLVNEMLDTMGIEYQNEKVIDFYSVDIYLPNYNLMIEVMGDFWHCNPQKFDTVSHDIQKKRVGKDKSKHSFVLKKYGIEILYLWESDIYKNAELCERLIQAYIEHKGKLHNYHSFNWTFDNSILKLKSELIYPYWQTAS